MGDARKHNTLFLEHNPADPVCDTYIPWGNGESGIDSQLNSLREGRVRKFCDFIWEG